MRLATLIMDTQHDTGPSPQLFFDTVTGYQRTAALKAGLDLNVFTQLAKRPAATAAELAKTCGASERGMRILCDNLAVQGFLKKTGDQYTRVSRRHDGIFAFR
jgi:hypothetical protein